MIPTTYDGSGRTVQDRVNAWRKDAEAALVASRDDKDLNTARTQGDVKEGAS